MNTNSIKKANLIDTNIIKSLKDNCYKEKISTKFFKFLQQYCYIIIIVILCIVFLSYRFVSKNTKKKEDDELHEQYKRYKEYKRQKKLQKKLNRLEQNTKIIPQTTQPPKEVINEPMPSNVHSSYALY